MTDPHTTPEDMVRAAFLEEARSYVGVRWLHMGRSRKGIDCVGLVVLAGRSCGLHGYLDQVPYSRLSSGLDLLAPFREHAQEVPLGPGRLAALRPADLLILRDQVYPQHVGIVADRAGEQTLIHASIHHGRVLEEKINRELERKAVTAFRFHFLT